MDGALGNGETKTADDAVSRTSGAPSVAGLAQWRAVLTEVDRAITDAERVDLLRALEELKSAACAAQALLSVDLEAGGAGAKWGAAVSAGGGHRRPGGARAA